MDISVFITSYNQKALLAEAVESVLQQTELPLEIIISDDASSDGSAELIRELETKHKNLIRGFVHQENVGIPRNKSYAIQQARGDWVAGLDGDDRFLPEKIERSRKTHEEFPEARVIFANHYFIDLEGKQKGLWARPGSPPPPSGSAFRQVFAKEYL